MQFAPKSAREQTAEPARAEPASEHERGATAGIPLFARELRVTDPADALELEPTASPSTAPPSGPTVSSGLRDAIAAATQDGAPLHGGPKAAELAQSLGAEAFTVNGQIFLGAGSQAAPSQALIAHELTHVAQQANGNGAWIGRQPAPALPDDAPLSLRAIGTLKEALSWPLTDAAGSGDDAGLGAMLGDAAAAALEDEIDAQQEAGLRARAAEAGAVRGDFGGESVGLAGAFRRLNELFKAGDDVPTSGDSAFAPAYMINGTAADIGFYLASGLDDPTPVPATPPAPTPTPTPGGAGQPYNFLLGNVQADLNNALEALTDGDRLLELELEATVHKLVELRGQFQEAAKQDERAAIGAQIGTTARKSLLLNQKLQSLKADRQQGKTPLDQKIEARVAEINALRAKGQKEGDALGELGDSPEQLTQTDIPIDNPFFEDMDIFADSGTQVQPEEAFPEALDDATRKMQSEMATRVRDQAAKAQMMHDQLVPKAPSYTLDELMGVHAHWFSLFSQEQERMNPMYKFFAETMLGTSYKLMGHTSLDAFGKAEGAIARVWMMGWAAKELESQLGGTSQDFSSQMEKFAPQRQQAPLGGSASNPSFRYGQIYPGTQASPDASAEEASRAALSGARQQETQPLRAPDFEKLDPFQKHMALIKAKAVSPSAVPLPEVVNGTPAEGWSYLVTVVDPQQEPVAYEQKVLSPEMSEYLLARQQQYAALKKPHIPTAESGKPVGDEKMRNKGVEGAQANNAERYLKGVKDPDLNSEKKDLDAAVADARTAGVPTGRSSDEASASAISGLSAEFVTYFDAFFARRKDGPFRVAAVLAISSAEFGLGKAFSEMTDPGTIALMMAQGFAIGFGTATLEAMGPLGQAVAGGLNAYLGRNATNPIAAATGVVAFIKGASEVGNFNAARAWAVVATAAADDFANLYAMVVMSGPQAAGGAAARQLIETLTKNPPTTAHALLETARPLLEVPESRARIIEGTRARIAELESQGAKPGAGNDEYDDLIRFEKMLRPYEHMNSSQMPADKSTDAFADAPLRGGKTETEATKFFEAGRLRTADERMALFNAIPKELQSSVMLVESPLLPGKTVRVRYDDGVLRLEVGPGAMPENIQDHVGVVRELTRYQGVVGTIRRLLSRVGGFLGIKPGYGSRGFEAVLERAKLEGIEKRLQASLADVEARADRLSKSPELAENQAEQEAIRLELESIQDQLAEHEAQIGSYEPGRGFVAAYAPSTAKGTLDMFLSDVFARGPTKGPEVAYRLYQRRTAPVPMEAGARAAYPKALLNLAKDPNVGSVVVQKGEMTEYQKTKLPTEQEVASAGFLHFRRGDFGKVPITERIYMNVAPAHAAEVMDFVVKNVMTPEPVSVEPGVGGTSKITRRNISIAKIATSKGIETRADTVVIGAASQADVEWALNKIADYQAAHPDHFLTELPAATHPEAGLTGVATAAEPPQSLGSGSFGSYLETIVTEVMNGTPPPATEADFKAQVYAKMKQDGIDPSHPDRLGRKQ